MLLQDGYSEAPKVHVAICVVIGVPDKDILEQITVCPKDIVYLGFLLPPAAEHALFPTVPLPCEVTWEEVVYHVLEDLHCNCC